MKKEGASRIDLIARFSEVIENNSSFIITTHVIPDGDGVGTEIALHYYLKSIGKKSQIINYDPTPYKLKLLDPDKEIKVFERNPKLKIPLADVIFIIDTNELERIGPLAEKFRGTKAQIVYLDHHISSEALKKKHLIDEKVSSVGELFYRYLIHIGAELDRKMALAIYVSILTDTSSFRYSRTTALSHIIAATLIDKGIDPEKIYQKIYATNTLAKLHLLGEVLSRIRTTAQGRIAWVELPKKLRHSYQASAEDTQGFINHILLIESAEVALLFREEDNHQIKVSFRSKGNYPIYQVAKKFGGGGHKYAAGLLLSGEMQEIVNKVLAELKKLFV